MSGSPRARAGSGAVALGLFQCAVLGVGALTAVTWAFIALTTRLALSTEALDAEPVAFWCLVGAVVVLVVASAAALALWRARPVGFTLLAMAWVPAVPVAWVTVASYLDLVVDDRLSEAVTVAVVLACANVVLGWVTRAPGRSPQPPVAG